MPTTPGTTPTAGSTTPVYDPNNTAPQDLGFESSLSNWAGDYVTDMLGKGWGLSEQPYQAYYGPLTAGITSLQDQAFQGIAGLTAPGVGTGTGQIAGEIGNMSYDPNTFTAQAWTNPGVAQSYMNPYVEQALTPQLEEIRRQAEITRLGDAGRYTQAGAYGGSRQAISESEGWDNMARLMNETTGKGYSDAYNFGADIFRSDADRNLRAQEMGEDSSQFGARYDLDAKTAAMRGYESQNDQNSRAFQNAMELERTRKGFGDTERQILQEGMDADRLQFEQERDFPYKQVQYMQSLLQGLPIASQNNSYSQPSWLNQFGAGAGGVASIAEMLANLFKGGKQ